MRGVAVPRTLTYNSQGLRIVERSADAKVKCEEAWRRLRARINAPLTVKKRIGGIGPARPKRRSAALHLAETVSE
jgi:hypothetical protein